MMLFSRKNQKTTLALVQAYLLVKNDRIIKRIKKVASFDANFGDQKSISKKKYEEMLKTIMMIVSQELTGKDSDAHEQRY